MDVKSFLKYFLVCAGLANLQEQTDDVGTD